MEQIINYECIYNFHPIFNKHAASEHGIVIDIKGNLIKIKEGDDGNLYVNLKWGPCEEMYEIKPFVWECFNGIIPSNCVIINYRYHKRIACLKYLRLFKTYENYTFYKLHPLYNSYSTDHYGNIFDIIKRPCIKRMDNNGYYFVNLKFGSIRHSFPIHIFVWECFNGIIPKNGVIEHINGNKKDNCKYNLILVLQNSLK